jgi:hypothetical protein
MSVSVAGARVPHGDVILASVTTRWWRAQLVAWLLFGICACMHFRGSTSASARGRHVDDKSVAPKFESIEVFELLR